jgi:hypothetical protein
MHKVLIERGSDRIVGAHLLGEGAPETVNLFAIAVRHGITAGDLESALYAYPTDGSNLPVHGARVVRQGAGLPPRAAVSFGGGALDTVLD